MWERILAVCLLAQTALSAASREPGSPWEKPVILESHWKYHAGDAAEWSRADWNDSGWAEAEIRDFEKRELLPERGVAWFRKAVELPSGGGPGEFLALQHFPLTPMELFWDGVPVGRSGRVAADEAGEAMGDRLMTYLPPRLTGPGKHVLAIRLSSHHRVFAPTPARILLGEGSELELSFYREAMVMVFLAGIFAFAAVFRFLNYRAYGYGRHALFFSISILSCSVYILLQYLWGFLDLGEGAFFATRVLVGVAWYCMLSLVPDYFVFAHAFPHRWVLPALLVAGLCFAVPMTLSFTGLAPFHYTYAIVLANQYFSYLCIGVSIWVIAWAVWRKQTGSGIALLGILLVLAAVYITWEFDNSWSWAVGLAAHVVCLARAQALQLSEKLRRHREDQLRSARLEIELLKKNIQPHFLLNSLNSIIAWLEEEPKTAVRLVNALADELHMLLKISAEKTIPLEEEIRLCQAHLQVMGLRQDKNYSLVYEGGPGEEHVPPMVLHTLVENGITHGYAGRNTGTFVLKREEVPGGMRYSLFNDGSPKAKPGKHGEGTGLRYVRTRLEEAFPGRWSLESRAVPEGWQVVLDLQDAGKAAHEGAYRRG